MHNQAFIHRDIKPENFLMGVGANSHVVYLVDLGFVNRIIDPKTKKHIEYQKRESLTGTATFASINAHNGDELSRRDDLESIAYVLIYLLRGKLPWCDLLS